MKIILVTFIALVIIFCTFVSVPIYVSNDCNILLPIPTVTKWGLPWKKIPCNYKGVMWGKSILEYGGDLKCSIDKQGFCFLFGSCKPDECTPKTEYETNNVAIQQLINNGCIVYYDGCNRCTVDKSNGQSMCTLRGCSEMDKPKCIEYKKY